MEGGEGGHGGRGGRRKWGREGETRTGRHAHTKHITCVINVSTRPSTSEARNHRGRAAHARARAETSRDLLPKGMLQGRSSRR